MTKIKLCLVTFGIMVGIVGALHGSAELLQGSTIVESRSVAALPDGWPNSGFYSMTSGSPVFSILTGIPFYALGILAISVSTAMIVFSATVFKRVKLGVGLLLFGVLNVGIFLFGAGRGTPILISAPVIITGVLSLVRTGQKQRSESSKRTILSAFYFFYGLHIFSWVFFFPGLFVYSFYTEISPAIFIFAFASMPIGAIGALIFGFLYDKTL